MCWDYILCDIEWWYIYLSYSQFSSAISMQHRSFARYRSTGPIQHCYLFQFWNLSSGAVFLIFNTAEFLRASFCLRHPRESRLSDHFWDTVRTCKNHTCKSIFHIHIHSFRACHLFITFVDIMKIIAKSKISTPVSDLFVIVSQ
jgi:hypothetical protein